MSKIKIPLLCLAWLFAISSVASAQSDVVVSLENFIHADSTRAYLKELDQTSGKVNIIRPIRELINTDNQDVIRMNRDTLYTRIILDVKGGASITTEDYPGFQNINVLDINHSQIASLTGSGTLKIDETMLTEGQHVYVMVRTGLIRELPPKEMMRKAHKAQDKVSISFNSAEPYVPSVNYDAETLDIVKYKILADFALNPKPDLIKYGFGTLKERHPEKARVVIAIGWGALAGNEAVYSAFTGYGDRESFTITTLPNAYDTGFFSITMYSADGYIATIKYAINSDDMIANKDGSYTINFLASGEPVKEGEQNVVRTPRGKFWTGILRSYNIKDKNEGFVWVDSWADKMNKAFKK